MSKVRLGQVLIVSGLLVVTNGLELENLVGSEIQQCINCLCHARTGCWRRTNCASYSISKEYWTVAGQPSISDGNLDQQYNACIKNENCILNTVKRYTDQYGRRDCNCDGTFDCKDRFAIHLQNKGDCMNPKYGETYARRFNDCADKIGVKQMVSEEGGFCSVPPE